MTIVSFSYLPFLPEWNRVFVETTCGKETWRNLITCNVPLYEKVCKFLHSTSLYFIFPFFSFLFLFFFFFFYSFLSLFLKYFFSQSSLPSTFLKKIRRDRTSSTEEITGPLSKLTPVAMIGLVGNKTQNLKTSLFFLSQTN